MQVLRAMRDGADVQGVYYWTLLDNFEWNAGADGAACGRAAWRGPVGRLAAAAATRRWPGRPGSCAAGRRAHRRRRARARAGYLMEFGLYAWRPDGSVDRVLKEGAKMLVGAGGGGHSARPGSAPGGSRVLKGLAWHGKLVRRLRRR